MNSLLTFILQEDGFFLFFFGVVFFAIVLGFLVSSLLSDCKDLGEARAQARGEARDAGVCTSVAVEFVAITPPRGKHGETSGES